MEINLVFFKWKKLSYQICEILNFFGQKKYLNWNLEILEILEITIWNFRDIFSSQNTTLSHIWYLPSLFTMDFSWNLLGKNSNWIFFVWIQIDLKPSFLESVLWCWEIIVDDKNWAATINIEEMFMKKKI